LCIKHQDQQPVETGFWRAYYGQASTCVDGWLKALQADSHPTQFRSLTHKDATAWASGLVPDT
jgi:hypothetical protein